MTEYVGQSIERCLEHQVPVGAALFKIHVHDIHIAFTFSTIICTTVLITICKWFKNDFHNIYVLYYRFNWIYEKITIQFTMC